MPENERLDAPIQLEEIPPVIAGEQGPPPNPDNTKPPEPPFFFRRGPRIALFCAMGLFATLVLIGGIVYLKYAGEIDSRLRQGPFSDTVDIFTAPRVVGVGDAISAADLIADLRRSGYTSSRENPVGW